MLFNTPVFLFGFLPVTLVGFFLVARRNHAAAAGWLGLMSLVFYGWWSVAALPLLLGSIGFNYVMGLLVTPAPQLGDVARKRRLVFALAVNLLVLATFKYADFFIVNANVALGAAGIREVGLLGIVLPIGISFYTFTQIAFIVDCYQGKVTERRFIHYLLFVTYFPHLISGPVLHHAQMMPQFRKPETYRLNWPLFYTGMSIFGIGLAKKTLLADSLADFRVCLLVLPGRSLYPRRDFYDASYHLTESHQHAHSSLLAPRLAAVLQAGGCPAGSAP